MMFLSFLKSTFKAFKNKIELISYNEYTISEYFRKKGAQIGNNCRILIHDFGSEPYLVKIGNDCIITPGVAFITHDASVGLFRREIPDLNIFGKIEIKDNCFIGLGSIILYDVTVGPNSVVGAGSIVTKDVPPNTVVAGVPAKVVCSIDEYKKKCLQKWYGLNLKGSRETWKGQLIKFFWSDTKE